MKALAILQQIYQEYGSAYVFIPVLGWVSGTKLSSVRIKRRTGLVYLKINNVVFLG